MAGSGPLVIGFDGSPPAECALREAGGLLRGRPAVVVVVHRPGVAFQMYELPAATIGLPPAPIDVRTALEIETELAEAAQRLARHGAELAREAGLEAEALAVADDEQVSVADTLVRVARERDAAAIVIGTHGYGPLGEIVLGSTSRAVIRHAPCPVVVARAPDDEDP
jgi:nucleotide-binding universal stress UspA family protein